MFTAALSGFLLSGSLIIAIGAQNAYVLRMGLARHHVFAICLFCALSDALLIVLGVAGLGALVDASPQLFGAISLGGGLFLAAYAVIAARRALNPQTLIPARAEPPPLMQALGVCAALTFLNPHVYLDTVMLVGAFSTQYSGGARLAFGAGAVAASFLWFFGLGYGARLLAPVFKRKRAWQLLDAVIALIMGALAIPLLAAGLGFLAKLF